MPFYEGELYRAYGNYYRALGPGHFEIAQEWYEKAVDVHTRLGMRLELGRDLLSLGAMFKRKQMEEKAKGTLSQAQAIFQAIGAEWDLAQAQKLYTTS